MNNRDIEQATSADLRGSWKALRRAAQRARELAAQTGTDLIVSRGGVIEHIKPLPTDAGQNARQPETPYENQR